MQVLISLKIILQIFWSKQEGRPISVTTNKDFEKKTNLDGGLNSRGYASVLSLYDSNRIKKPLKNNNEITWRS